MGAKSPGRMLLPPTADAAIMHVMNKGYTTTAPSRPTYHTYYNGQQMVEVRNNLSQVLKQYVWGLQYIDELVQVAINQDPVNATSCATGGRTENACERFFWALQDVNYNVLGIVTRSGGLIERYEYTPYGQRTIFSRSWMLDDLNGDGTCSLADLSLVGAEQGSTDASAADLNGDGIVDDDDDFTSWDASIMADPLVMNPTLESFRTDSQCLATGGYGSLCDIGHQGLLHDREFGPAAGGLIHNRARTLNPTLGRFMQRDPLGYPDGMNGYSVCRSNPGIYRDPDGTRVFGKKDVLGWVRDHLKESQTLSQQIDHRMSTLASHGATTKDLKNDDIFVMLAKKYLRHEDYLQYDLGLLRRGMCNREGDRTGGYAEIGWGPSNISNPDEVREAVKVIAIAGAAATILEVVGPSPAKTYGAKSAELVGTVVINGITYSMPHPLEAGLHAEKLRKAATECRRMPWMKVQCFTCAPEKIDTRDFLVWQERSKAKWVLVDDGYSDFDTFEQ
ncbi:MAG: RHS repeat-associated core domain-containing protein, partial [Phycisphaerae bacterium]